MAKKYFQKALSVGLSLALCLGLAAPAFATAEEKPTVDDTVHDAPILTTDEETVKNTVPNEDPYKTPYDEAKEADKLDGEDLDGVNGQIDGAASTANGKIDTANENADKAAADAGEALKGIDTETHLKDANDAANEANSYAEQAQDTNLTLDEREEAAANAAKAADAAKEAAKKADEQVEAAQKVLDDAEAALKKANEDYEKAVADARALIEGNEDEPGLQAKAQALIKDAEAKVNSAKEGLKTAKGTFDDVEKARQSAWSASETARIASEQAASAAWGKQDVIDGAKDTHSQDFVDANKDQVDTKADKAISAKKLEDAAQGVVNAQTKVDDLEKLDKLTTEEKKLADAKKARDEAEATRKKAQTNAKNAKDDLQGQIDDGSAGVANGWLGVVAKAGCMAWQTRRDVINAVISGKYEDWMTESVIQEVIKDAKNHGQLTDGGKYIVRIGNTLETLRTARADLATEEGKLKTAVEAVKIATNTDGKDAQEVLDALDRKIGAINTNGKYNEDLNDLTAAIGAANQAVGSAKTLYTQAGGNANLSDLASMKKALEDASTAYTNAINALNSTAGTSLDKDQTTVVALEALKTLKANVETAKSLIAEMERTKGVYDGKVSEYNTAKDAAESANNQYQAAKKAVEDAEKKLEQASVHSASYNPQKLQALQDALTAAQLKLNDAEAAKDAADTAEEEARKKAEEAEDAYNQAVADANEAIGGGDGDTGDTDVTIDDEAVPLASGPVTCAQFVDYLWRHEGSPEAESELFADHEYAPAIAWALSAELIDETFQPDELVTGADVRAILDNFARVFGTNAVAVADLTTLTGDDGEAVLNCDEVLAEFFGEAYLRPEDLDNLEIDDAA